ncbi:MAG: hypothetical protein Q9P14_07185 [candidate division KSB1 bacterium]|nr:hypothetical protein [candidate division KSB1 bacterium]
MGVYENDDGLDQRLQFGLPVAVTFSRFGELFVIDGENQRILRFNANGEPEQSFGDWDWGDGRLEEPVAICLNDRDVERACSGFDNGAPELSAAGCSITAIFCSPSATIP